MNLPDTLRNNFTIVNLGSGGDFDYNLPDNIRRNTILIEIDAADKSKGEAEYLRRESLKKVVAGTTGPRTFRVNKYTACSSLRDPKPELVKRYDLAEYFEIVSREMVECETLPNLLSELNISKVDFLKTDLEGEDLAVIKSMDLSNVLAIQSEFRFEPFYEGEPDFCEAVQYLRRHEFELIGLRPEYWRVPDSKFDDGKIVWADTLFLKKTQDNFEVAKQVVILSMLGRRGYASYLIDKYNLLWKEELNSLTAKESGLKDSLRSLYYRTRNLFRPKSTLKHLAKW